MDQPSGVPAPELPRQIQPPATASPISHGQDTLLPLPLDEIGRHSANVHLIPANDSVESDLLRFSPGQVITLIGRLVRVSSAQGFSWESSLMRGDTGGGSCEVMYVDKAFPRPVPVPPSRRRRAP